MESTTESPCPYVLVSEIFAHSGPVRSLSMGPLGEIVSGCQGQADAANVRRWAIFTGGSGGGADDSSAATPGLEELGEPIQHDKWVTALTHLAPGAHPRFPEGAIISGSLDFKIRVFSAATPATTTPATATVDEDAGGASASASSSSTLLQLQLTLEGHTKGVISFSWTSDGMLISGGWDGTARIWDLGAPRGAECIQVLAKV